MSTPSEVLDQIIALAREIEIDGTCIDTWEEAKAAAARIAELAEELKTPT